MNVLILHGIMGRAGENRGTWLQASLENKSYHVVQPTLPNAEHPDRNEWHVAIDKYMSQLGSDKVLVIDLSV